MHAFCAEKAVVEVEQEELQCLQDSATFPHSGSRVPSYVQMYN